MWVGPQKERNLHQKNDVTFTKKKGGQPVAGEKPRKIRKLGGSVTDVKEGSHTLQRT